MTIFLIGVLLGPAAVEAQSATPSVAGVFSNLGLPEITLTATDEGLELSRTEVPAGRYLITLDNRSGDPELYVEIAKLLEEVSSVSSTSCPELLRPECFTWYSQNVLPGGVSGGTPQTIVELPPGKYGLWGPGERAIEPAATLTVAAGTETDSDGQMLEAARIRVAKGEGGYGFVIHVEGALKPGPQLIAIVNEADQPLYVAVGQNPDSLAAGQKAGTPRLDASSNTFSPLDTFDDSLFGQIAYTEPQSSNTTQWIVLNLLSGPVFVASYVPDPIATDYFGWYAAIATVVSAEDH